MKFILMIWVCSFLDGKVDCLPPVEYPKYQNSWYECQRLAQKESLTLMSKMGYKYVNDNKIGIKYYCKLVETI